MTNLQSVPIEMIDHNPFRNVGNYPFVQRKVEALMRSIEVVGLWEGLIGRQNGNRFELAFGHHRYEAARRLELPSIPIIVRDLNDEQMLSFMGRENLEDYNADFLSMLETWEAAAAFFRTSGLDAQAVVIARLLGWTRIADRATGEIEVINDTAQACSTASRLINDGHIARADLADLNVSSALRICDRAQSNIDRIEKAGKALGTPAPQVAAAKEAVAKAVKTTAKESRAGIIPAKDLRSQVDVNAYKHAQASKVKDTPLFGVFGKTLADSINKMLHADSTANRLDEVIKAIPEITMEDDNAIVRRLDFELNELSERALKYKGKMKLTSDKVTPFKAVSDGRDA